MRTKRNDIQHRNLASLADVAGGVALGSSVPSGASVELPYLRVANVQDGYITTDDMKTLHVPASSIERFRLKRDDVLLTEGGDFDKLGRGAVWDGRIDPCLHQNHIFRVRCHESELLPTFLALYMASPKGRSYFLRIAKQTTNLATISSSQLRSMPIPHLPLAEQQRIVEVIDAVSAQERAIEASIAKLHGVRQGTLIEVFPAGIPSKVVTPCSFVPLEHVADVGGGITLGGEGAGGGTTDVPYLRVANVQDGYISTREMKTVRATPAEVERFRLRRGDVLLTEGGDLDKLGRGGVWDGRIDPCLHQNHIFRVRCITERILPEFLAFYLASPEGRSYILKVSKQTTNLASVSSSQIRRMPVPCPSIQEQRRVIELITAHDVGKFQENLELAKLRAIKQGLTDGLLASRSVA